jgi:transposase
MWKCWIISLLAVIDLFHSKIRDWAFKEIDEYLTLKEIKNQIINLERCSKIFDESIIFIVNSEFLSHAN